MILRKQFSIFALTALLFTSWVNSPAQARDSFLDIKEVTSESGITAWLVEDHSIPIIALSFAFKDAGAAQDEPEKQGLAQLASNTLDEGAGNITSEEFQKELRDLAITLRYNSGRDHFEGELKTLTKNSDRAFELLALSITEPRFDEAPLARMIAANQSRIRRSQSDPEWMAARLLNDKAYSNHPYAQNSGGTLSSLSALTANDLREFTSARLAKNNLVISVAGDITADELKTRLDSVFGNLQDTATLKSVPDTEIQNQGKIFLHDRDIPQTVIQISQPGISRHHPDYQIAQVMNFVLGSSGFGSRLTEEIREKRGLTYGIYSYFTDHNHAQSLSISTSTQNSNVSDMLNLIKQEWTKLANEPISNTELSNAQSYLTGALPLSMTSTKQITDLLLSIQLDGLPITYLDDRNAKLNAVTVDDVQNLASKLLNTDQWTTVLVGPSAALESSGVAVDETIATLPNVE